MKKPKYNCLYKCEDWGEFIVCMLDSATRGEREEKKGHKEKRSELLWMYFLNYIMYFDFQRSVFSSDTSDCVWRSWSWWKESLQIFCTVRNELIWNRVQKLASVQFNERLSKGQNIIFSVFSLSSLITDMENFNSNQILKHKVFLNSHYDRIFSYELSYKQVYQTLCT